MKIMKKKLYLLLRSALKVLRNKNIVKKEYILEVPNISYSTNQGNYIPVTSENVSKIEPIIKGGGSLGTIGIVESIIREGNIVDLEKTFKEKKIIAPSVYVSKYKKVYLKYPLITSEIGVLAWAEIKYDKNLGHLIYFVHEPEIDKRDKEIIDKTIEILEEKLDIDFSAIKNIKEAYNYINKKINEIWKFLKIKYPKEKEYKVKYYIFRDTVGLGKIEPLMHDPYIEDISCDGVGIPIYVYHRNPAVGEVQTNIVFETEEELDSFVMKLAQRTGKTVSAAQPLLDGTLPDGSRVQITYGKDIARRGSNFSIRKFTKEPLTPVDLINYGTANEEIFAYLWSAIESQLSILVAGGTATGKTTLLNAIALFIKPEMKIVSIEDTAELQLPHPNWIPQVARVGFGPSNYGAIDMFDLLKAALRQRPDYIIVGEVRGREAYVLFQGIATGHPALGTIHADSMRAIIDRLTSPPINLPMVLLENLDIAVFMKRTRIKGEYVRRVSSIEEIVGYNYRKKMVEWIRSFEWDPASDTFISHKSYMLKKIMELKGLKEEEFKEDLKFKRDILSWLRKNNIRNYKEIAKYLELYYYEPEKLSKIIYGTI